MDKVVFTLKCTSSDRDSVEGYGVTPDQSDRRQKDRYSGYAEEVLGDEKQEGEADNEPNKFDSPKDLDADC